MDAIPATPMMIYTICVVNGGGGGGGEYDRISSDIVWFDACVWFCVGDCIVVWEEDCIRDCDEDCVEYFIVDGEEDCVRV